MSGHFSEPPPDHHNWSGECKVCEAREIHIDVQDGRVRLSGVVHSWAEKKAVIAAARGASGVRRVDNDLRIEPYVA